MRHALFISLTLLAGAMPVQADQPAATPPSSAQLGAIRPPQNNPYSRLFELREALKQAQQQVAQVAPKKKIVCGMTVIEVGPSIDPKMGVTPPKDPNVRYTIRAVEPPICGSSNK